MTRWERFKRLLRPPRRLRITRVGGIFLLLTVGIGIAALNTGNNLLYLVLGFQLSIIVMSGVLSERALRGIHVRRLLPEGASAQEPFAVRYELTVDGRAFGVRVTERDSVLTGIAYFPYVEAGAPQIARADHVAPRRGPLKLTSVELTTAFPIGLFEKSMPVPLEDTLLVFPKRGFVCDRPNVDHQSRHGDVGNPRNRDGTGDLLGLKELQPGEDGRRIHWKKSASAGRLLKAEREREDRRQYTLRVDGKLSEEALERACEETAAMAHLLVQEGHEVGLETTGQRLRPAPGAGQERRILTALAWLGFDDQGAR